MIHMKSKILDINNINELDLIAGTMNVIRKGYEFIKDNTEKDALIICWWPHGKRIQLFTGRETLVAGPSAELISGLSVQNERYKEATRRYELTWLREKEGLADDQKLKDVDTVFADPDFQNQLANYNEFLTVIAQQERARLSVCASMRSP